MTWRYFGTFTLIIFQVYLYTQIQNVCTRKREIMEEYDSNSNPESKRVRRVTANDEINELCYKWFGDATSRKVNVSGPLLQQKALKIASDLNFESVKASNGWLEAFLKRHNIVFKTMSGERGKVNMTTVDSWKERLPTVCANDLMSFKCETKN